MTRFGRYMRLVVMINRLKIIHELMNGYPLNLKLGEYIIYGGRDSLVLKHNRYFDLSKKIPANSRNYRGINQVAGRINEFEKTLDETTANYFADCLEEIYQRFIEEKAGKISDQTRLQIIVAAMQLGREKLKKTWPVSWNRLDESHSDFWRMMQVAISAETYIPGPGYRLLEQVREELGEFVV